MTQDVDIQVDWSRVVTDEVLKQRLPTLHLEDVSAIPFVDGVAGVEQYQHRARVRAHDGDLFASTTPPTSGYEDYCRETLRMGRVTEVLAEPVEGYPTQVAKACMRGRAFEQLCEVATAHGGLVLHPYMGHESVWELAEKIEESVGVPIYVYGPRPEALWVANDKARLTELVEGIDLGGVLAETLIHRDVASIAHALRDMASRHDRVALKRTRCASAMGNQVFASKELREMSSTEVDLLVENFLAHTQWGGDEDILVVEWIDWTSSPSSQLWVPALQDAHNEVRVDGLYEQLLVGEQGVFLGSMPSRLPESVEAQMREVSIRICQEFQKLGYVGRCSFDFVIDRQGRARLTECNGRWGGTSSPMYLVDRSVKAEARPAYIAQDFVHEELVGMRFEELLERIGEHVFDVKTQQGRFLFYNVGPLEKKGKFDVVSLGDSHEDALHGVKTLLPQLLGLDS